MRSMEVLVAVALRGSPSLVASNAATEGEAQRVQLPPASFGPASRYPQGSYYLAAPPPACP